MTSDWRAILESLSPDALIDAHTHSLYSDGTEKPEEIIRLAVDAGLSGVCISDHDTLEGYLSLKPESVPEDFLIIPGIEFTAYWEGHEVHILGYGVDPSNPELVEFNNTFKDWRRIRARRILENLNEVGIPLQWDEFEEKYPDIPIGRPHIANELVQGGYCRNVYEAFNKYLSNSSSIVVAKFSLKVSEAVRISHNAGGKAVLAHPGQLPVQVQMTHLITAGIDGIEGYYPQHHPMQERAFARYAAKRNIPVTGGSDFHGRLKPRISVGDRTTTAKQFRELLGI